MWEVKAGSVGADLLPRPRPILGYPEVVVLLRPVAVDLAGPQGVEGALQRRAPSAIAAAPMAVAFPAADEKMNLCRSARPPRSEERRVGKEGVSTCRSRWSTSH